ncbi:hypothetical protein KZJ38_33250 [Paraburkholderia edwinii]|uniref:Lipoprotein n=1 Tax=Paraburkholderia edwinii TaxID=2861782 RepID=A0ABX8US65_9BURK|nr:hypothetical protein [Paraburkholderia edwinii]QYD71837.1 hypothetical protein KZJ38_33250 [Paraburkholderia edwinii]
MDGDFLSKLAAAWVALLSVFMLTACGPGPGDASAANNAANSAANNASASNDSAGSTQNDTSRYQSTALQLAAGASVPLSQLQAPPLVNMGSGSAVASAQASVAADAIQVAPVMRYAPGDSAN